MSDPETQDLPELLREISELAPEVIRIFKGESSGVDMIHVDGYGLLKRLDNVARREDYAIIQAALQEAIEDRGWPLIMDYDLQGWTVELMVHYGHTVSADDPATALAMAFLEALRAEQ